MGCKGEEGEVVLVEVGGRSRDSIHMIPIDLAKEGTTVNELLPPEHQAYSTSLSSMRELYLVADCVSGKA